MSLRTEHPSLRQGLVGAWCPSLGATGLTLLDRSGRNNHGVLTNMGGQDNWRASGSGVALNFDGTNDFALIPATSSHQFSIGQSFTVSCWIYPSATKNHAIVGYGTGGWAVYLQGNYLELAKSGVANAGSNATTNGVTLNQWAHCAVINVVGSTVQFFINGVSVRSAAFTQTYTYTTSLGIGDLSALNLLWNGQLDDIRIYSRAITPAEIGLLASRRGIGLSPLPDRGAALPRRFSVNVGGDWRSADSYVNVGGVWRLGQPSVNVSGTWK